MTLTTYYHTTQLRFMEFKSYGVAKSRVNANWTLAWDLQTDIY